MKKWGGVKMQDIKMPTKDEIIKHYQDGLTVVQIARIYNVPDTRMYNYCARNKLFKKDLGMGRVNVTEYFESNLDYILNAVKAGKTYNEIAESIGMTGRQLTVFMYRNGYRRYDVHTGDIPDHEKKPNHDNDRINYSAPLNQNDGVYKVCAVCGKRFYLPEFSGWGYKKDVKNIQYYMCTYSCTRYFEDNTERVVNAVKAAKKREGVILDA